MESFVRGIQLNQLFLGLLFILLLSAACGNGDKPDDVSLSDIETAARNEDVAASDKVFFRTLEISGNGIDLDVRVPILTTQKVGVSFFIDVTILSALIDTSESEHILITEAIFHAIEAINILDSDNPLTFDLLDGYEYEVRLPEASFEEYDKLYPYLAGEYDEEEYKQEYTHEALMRLNCVTTGRGTFTVSVSGFGEQSGDLYDVFWSFDIECIDDLPTPTPAPAVQRTVEVLTFLIDGEHYPASQFVLRQPVGLNLEICSVGFVTANKVGFPDATSSGRREFITNPVFSFETLVGQGLQEQSQCGFGTQSELIPAKPFEVDLPTFEAFCDRYIEATLPERISPNQVTDGSGMLIECEGAIGQLRK